MGLFLAIVLFRLLRISPADKPLVVYELRRTWIGLILRVPIRYGSGVSASRWHEGREHPAGIIDSAGSNPMLVIVSRLIKQEDGCGKEKVGNRR
jgi:hypothetical protein